MVYIHMHCVCNSSRGFGSRGGFDEPITSPRREFSRSMSSENWREAKRTTGNETREEQDDGEGDWRRAGPRERWSAYFSCHYFSISTDNCLTQMR